VRFSQGNQFGMRGGRLMIANLSNRRLTETAYNQSTTDSLSANLVAVFLSLPSAAVN
jgi:hypothetical protein